MVLAFLLSDEFGYADTCDTIGRQSCIIATLFESVVFVLHVALLSLYTC